MKRLITVLLVSIPFMAGAESSKALDYCAMPQSWATQKTILAFTKKEAGLDSLHAKSKLLNRTALKDKSVPVVLGGWGPLYTQTIKVTLPFVDNKKPPKTIIVTSIISAEECSLSEPSYVDMSLGS